MCNRPLCASLGSEPAQLDTLLAKRICWASSCRHVVRVERHSVLLTAQRDHPVARLIGDLRGAQVQQDLQWLSMSQKMFQLQRQHVSSWTGSTPALKTSCDGLFGGDCADGIHLKRPSCCIQRRMPDTMLQFSIVVRLVGGFGPMPCNGTVHGIFNGIWSCIGSLGSALYCLQGT